MPKSKLQKREGALARLEHGRTFNRKDQREKPGAARTPEQKQEEAARLRSLIAARR